MRLAWLFLFLLCSPWAQAQEVVEAGSQVTLHYTILENGAELTSTEEPFEMVIGANSFLPDLQRELLGMREGETRTVRLEPARAFGEIDPENVATVPLETLPDGARKVGSYVKTRDGGGNSVIYKVKAIDGDQALLDLNHPWAGKTLTFQVKLVKLASP